MSGVHALKEIGGVVPRAVAGLKSSDWSPASPRGARQLIEVVADQLVLSGMSLIGGRAVPATLPSSTYAVAAQELSALGVAKAHTEPQPLRVRRFAGTGSAGCLTRG